jgi:GT2 family glycosyltransferase
MRVGCVVLTTGQRPEELRRALGSIVEQRKVSAEIVVVLNREEGEDGAELGLDPELVGIVTPGSNLGIPGGRNVGVAALGEVELVLFLDDDAELASADLLDAAVERFRSDPTLGVLTMRIVDPDTGETQRRHVPRLRVGDPLRSSWVTTFLGGASIIRLDAFEAAGGLPDAFFYAHEETSLAWRLLDAGYRIRYAADLVVHHPGLPPARHTQYYRLSARNRVLLARQHLPIPLALVYVAVWAGLSLARAPAAWRTTLRGFHEGIRQPGVTRRPIGWSTVWRMARYGRPPVV